MATAPVVQEWDASGKPLQSSTGAAAPAITEWDASGKPVTSSIISNPNGEGTYRMVGRNGPVQIPYSNVATARQQGLMFSGGDAQRYAKDASADSKGDSRSLLQKAKDNFQRSFDAASADITPEERKKMGPVAADIAQAVHTTGGILGAPLAHPLDTLGSIVDSGKEVLQLASTPVGQTKSAIPALNEGAHPLQDTAASIANDYKTMPVDQAIAKSVGTAAGMYAGGKVLEPVASAVGDAPRNAVTSAARVVAGDKLDTPIMNDHVTPRELYQTAKDMGVNLDTAQATGSSVAQGAKRFTEHSLGGSSKFEDNRQANIQALHMNAEKILDSASPNAMSREDFGNVAKNKLLEHQQDLNSEAGDIYKQLDAEVGASKPDASGIRSVAKSIVNQNKNYFDAHPEILSGGDKKAWAIVQDLASSADVKPAKTGFLDAPSSEFAASQEVKLPHQDSWSDMHKLRSDLMDITRGKDLVGSRATGWIKQLTGAVDDAMTDPKGMSPQAAEDFRTANNLYSLMKSTYDDPRSRLYHVVRAPDGLTAANTLSNVSPQVARQVARAAPDLAPQLQRQAIERILNPAGNDVPDLQNLPSRLSRVQKEQLRGVLTPDQMQHLDDLGRVARAVNYDSNSSGTAKVGQKVVEAGAIGSGLMRAGLGVVSGNPLAVAEGAAPIAYAGAQRGIAKAITNPKFTDAVMNASRSAKPTMEDRMVVPSDSARGVKSVTLPVLTGKAKWASDGADNLKATISQNSSSGLSASDVDELAGTPNGKNLLMRASSLTPGSQMMKNILLQAQKLLKERTK